MAGYTRSYGATARSQGWDEEEESKTRGNWLPLHDLAEEDLFAGTPRLQPPAGERQATAVQPRVEQPLRKTAPQRTTIRPISARNEVTEQADPAAKTMRGVEVRRVATVAGLVLAGLALYVAVSSLLEWTQVKLDDMQYGRPRTMQLDAYVGHGEAAGLPTHFVAMNLNRRVTVLELQGGDSGKAQTIVGPYLFGQGEDLTPVQAQVHDVNGDGKPDLVVTVKNEQLIYLNDGGTFKLIAPEERAALQKQMQGRPATAATTASLTPEAAK